MSKTDRDLLILTLGRGLQVIGLFLNYKLLAYFLKPSEVGFYFLLLAIVSYFGLVLINPVGTYLNRELHGWSEKYVLLPFLLLFFIFNFLAHLLVLPVCFVLSTWIDFSPFSPFHIALFVGFYSFAASLGNTFVPALNILNHRVSFVVLTVCIHFVGLALSVGLVLLYRPSAIMWLAGLGAAYLFFGCVAMAMLGDEDRRARRAQSTPPRSALDSFHFKEILSFAAPIALTNSCLWLITQSYRPMTEYFTTMEFLGYAGFGLGLASTLSVTFEYLLQQFYFPDFYKNINSEDKSQRETAWNTYANPALSIYFSLAIFVSLMSPFIIRFISSPEYKAAAYFLAIGIWAETLRATNNVLNLISQSERNTKRTIWPYFLGGITTSGALFLTGKFDIFETALPFALCFGNMVVAVTLVRRFRHDFFIDLSVGKILARALPVSATLFVVPLYPLSESLWTSFGALAVFGSFFLFTQYRSLKTQ